MNRLPRVWWHVGGLLLVLAIVALLAPEPWYETDREHYQELGRDVMQQDCSSLHCARALLPAILEHLPGPSIPKWKAFAVIANTWAAAAVAGLVVQLGLSPRVAFIALWLSGLGFGGLFTLFDPFSADPLMFVLGPLLTTWLLQGRLKAAGVVAAVGVFAKEFAAAPLWIWTGTTALANRWFDAMRTGTLALTVTTLWLVLQVALVIGFNQSYGASPSADLLGGGYIGHWFEKLGARVAIGALLTEYGPMYVLIPIGFLSAPAELKRLAIAALPAVLAFGYVQQPDRALWNFHFLVTPLAALVLARVSLGWVLALLGSFAIANFRLAAQLQFLPAARYALALSMLIAVGIVVSGWRGRRPVSFATAWPAEIRTLSRAYRALLAGSVVVVAAALVLVADISAHRAVEKDGGLNRHGYRGDIMRAKPQAELRVAIAGGATAFSPDVQWPQSLGFVLERFLGQRWRWKEFIPASVANLSLPNDTAATVAETLRRYDYLRADIVCIVTGHNDLPGVWLPAGGRIPSAVFRVTGYLPVLPAVLSGTSSVPPTPELPVDAAWIRKHAGEASAAATSDSCRAPWLAYCNAVVAAVEGSLSQGRRVLVVAEPYISEAHRAQQRALAAMLAHRYGDEHRVRYLDLGWFTDQRDSTLVTGGWKLTPRGIEQFAEGLFTGVFSMVVARS